MVVAGLFLVNVIPLPALSENGSRRWRGGGMCEYKRGVVSCSVQDLTATKDCEDRLDHQFLYGEPGGILQDVFFGEVSD